MLPTPPGQLLRSEVDPTIAVDPAEVARAVEEVFPEALGVWIFGSFADGSARRDSDIDLAILPDRALEADWHYLGRLGHLSLRLGRQVDLVDLRKAPPSLRFEVFSAGVRVAARDPSACDFFETSSISAYQRLNVERRDIIEAIAARGTVY